MWIALVIVAGVVGLFLLIAVLSRAMLASVRKPLEARVQRRYGSRPLVAVDYAANSFGLESLGKLQARGNGALVVTADEVCFLQLVPEREVVIPLAQIRELSVVRSHLGKATPFKLLKIQFESAEGPDAIAVMVRRSDDLRALIEQTRAGSPKALQS